MYLSSFVVLLPLAAINWQAIASEDEETNQPDRVLGFHHFGKYS